VQQLAAAAVNDSDDNNPFDVAENRDYLSKQNEAMEINQLIINVGFIILEMLYNGS
jgi:hypothetical protein